MTYLRTCRKCGVEKEISEFPVRKRKGANSGHRYECKLCVSLYNLEYRKLNADRIKEKQSEYYKDNREKVLDRSREWQKNNRDRANERDRLWRIEYYKNNPEKLEELRSRQAKYRKDNRERRSEYASSYNANLKKLKPEYFAAKEARRKARKLMATPKWLTEEHHQEIESVYILARDCRVVSGEEYHVDHIVPLKGDNICGLHVPWNLQVLPSDINMLKGNKMMDIYK